MNIDEIKAKFTSGFHDSDILEINIDYLNEKVAILFDIDLTTVEGRDTPVRRKGWLRLSGVLYIAIEPPTGAWPGDYIATDDKMWISSDTSDFASLTYSEKSYQPKLPQILPNKSFQHCFYSSSHNSCIYLAAMDATFEWVD